MEHTITLGDSPVFYRTATDADAGGDADVDAPPVADADAGGDADVDAPRAADADAGGDADVDAPRVAPGDAAEHITDPVTPTVYVHGIPTSSDDWLPFLERAGGIAPDLIGFGRSGKGGHLDYSPEGLADFLGRFLDEIHVQQLRLVLHDWGAAAGVLLAAQAPDRIDRLVLINPAPMPDAARWPWLTRAWRTRLVGELTMGFTSRMLMARWLRRGSVNPDAWPSERVGQVWEQFDQGTQRATLRLTRSIDDDQIRMFAAALRSLDVPTLVVWGERDPWGRPQVADAYAALLPLARLTRIPDAGHWPWLDDPSVIDLVSAFR